ncbi:MAG: sugar phosphate isomerase/epimerase [Defluviitaleaceae bacterium]|nr:sugar phosphate isomerase/epimerase [Defluviitaleaceae bacterium]
MQIGVVLDSFRLPPRDAILRTAKLGITGIQPYAVAGDFAPENMTAEKAKEWVKFAKDNGIVFSALCGDMHTAFNLDNEQIRKNVERSKRILDMALLMECNVVTTHIPAVPKEENAEKEILRKNCKEMADYAASIGAFFAIETGPEPASSLKEFLDSLGSKGLSVNLDPANLVMVVADDPVAAVYTLKDYIVHTHAKDGIQVSANPVSWEELPLGQGGVDWDKYLQALREINFNGFLTIEREVGDDPDADITLAAQFLRAKLS